MPVATVYLHSYTSKLENSVRLLVCYYVTESDLLNKIVVVCMTLSVLYVVYYYRLCMVQDMQNVNHHQASMSATETVSNHDVDGTS